MNVPPNTEWNEARLAVFLEIKRLSDEVARISAVAEINKDKLENKQATDINKAFEKIRATDNAVREMKTSQRTRASILGGAWAFVAVLLIEAFKYFLGHH